MNISCISTLTVSITLEPTFSSKHLTRPPVSDCSLFCANKIKNSKYLQSAGIRSIAIIIYVFPGNSSGILWLSLLDCWIIFSKHMQSFFWIIYVRYIYKPFSNLFFNIFICISNLYLIKKINKFCVTSLSLCLAISENWNILHKLRAKCLSSESQP